MLIRRRNDAFSHSIKTEFHLQFHQKLRKRISNFSFGWNCVDTSQLQFDSRCNHISCFRKIHLGRLANRTRVQPSMSVSKRGWTRKKFCVMTCPWGMQDGVVSAQAGTYEEPKCTMRLNVVLEGLKERRRIWESWCASIDNQKCSKLWKVIEHL